jgi:hypothetical protein
MRCGRFTWRAAVDKERLIFCQKCEEIVPHPSQCATDCMLPSDTMCLSCSGCLAQGIGLVPEDVAGFYLYPPARALAPVRGRKIAYSET